MTTENDKAEMVNNLLSALEAQPRTRKELVRLTDLPWSTTERLLMSLGAKYGVQIAFDKKTERYVLQSRGQLG